MSRECLEAVLSELEAAGIEPTVEHRRKHVHIFWEVNGMQRSQVIASTASDWRAVHNERAQTRRMLRDDGLIGEVDGAVIELPRLALRDGAPVVSSLDVARHFSKAHKDVLRSIDRIMEEVGREFTERNFTLSAYTDPSGRELRAFDMTRDGFSFLVMGFTGAAASKWKVAYIDAFNAMQRELVAVITPSLPVEIDARLSRVESDVAGLIDLMATPREIRRVRSGVFMRASVRRKLLRMAA